MRDDAHTGAAAGTTFFTVFGVQRSGNILLAELLRAQPTVDTGDAWLDDLLKLADDAGLRLHQPLKPHHKRTLLRATAKAVRHYPGLSETLEATRATEFNSVAQLMTELYRSCWRPGWAAVGTRLHGPAGFLGQLLHHPTVRLVILVRDVRDVILSEIHRGRLNIDHHVRQWRRAARFAHQSQDHPNLLALRYEDLLAQPSTAAARLSVFLRTPVDFTAKALETARWPTGHSSFGPLPRAISRVPADRWKQMRDHPAVHYAGMVSHRELRDWGYEVPAMGSPLSARRWRPRLRSTFHAVTSAGRRLVKQQLVRRFFSPTIR